MRILIKKKKIKKYISIVISLIFLLMLQPFSYVINFKVQQYHIHNKMRNKLEKAISENSKDLILLKIPATIEKNNSLVFQRMHEWEFRYYGYMFDIVKKEIHNDTTWYYCIYDKEETQLMVNLERLLRQKKSPLKFIQINTHNILNSIICFDKRDCIYKNIIVMYELTAYNFSIITWIDEPPTHPPKICT